jgi:predicted nucleic acid-binding protein
MIGKRLASLADVLCCNDVQVYMSDQLLDEIQTVVQRHYFSRITASVC